MDRFLVVHEIGATLLTADRRILAYGARSPMIRAEDAAH